MRFENQVAVITGAAGVIDASAARRLLAEGARIALPGRNAQALEALVSPLAREGATQPMSRTCAWPVDATDSAVMHDTAGQVARHFGPVDIFSTMRALKARRRQDGTNRGLPGRGARKRSGSQREWRISGHEYFAPKIRDDRSVVITSSVAGLGGTPAFVGYVTSKHAVTGIMRTAVLDLAPKKIRGNTVIPQWWKAR